MAARLTVFCEVEPPPLEPQDLRRMLDEVDDMYAFAEAFGVEDEAAVDAALDAVSIEGGGDSFVVQYRAEELRPIEVEVVRGEEEVSVATAEAHQSVDTSHEEGSSKVFGHLRRTVAIVDFALGFLQLEDMGIVLADALAERLARDCGGIIRDQNDDWWRMDEDGQPVLMVGPDKR